MSHTPRLAAIAAMDERRVIGHAGALPWHHPEDLKFFKNTTLGHPVLMGRTTYESIGRPLPGRQNLVLSRSMPETQGVTLVRELSDLAEYCPEEKTVFVIGGAQVYAQLLPLCAELYLTWVAGEHAGDTFFPPFEAEFELAEVLSSTPELEFRRYTRKSPPAFIDLAEPR